MPFLENKTEFIAVTHHESKNGLLILQPVIDSGKAVDFLCEFVNSEGAGILGSEAFNIIGKKISEYVSDKVKKDELLKKFQLVFNSKKTITVYEYRETGIINHFISEAEGKIFDFIHRADYSWFKHDFQSQLALIQASNDAFIVHDLNNNVIFWNQGAEKMYGWSETEVLGKSASKILNTKSPVPLNEIFRHTKVDHTWRGELIQKQKNGLYIVVDSRWELLGNNQILEINRDITSQKQTENDLLHERELLQKIINRIPVMITVYNPNKENFYINNEFERVLGWTNDDTIESNLMEKCYPDPKYRQKVTKFMDSLKDGWADLMVTDKTGIQIETSWSNIQLPDGTRVGIGLDMRERKELERKKDDFINMASHELKTPITTIKAYTQILKKTGKDSKLFLDRVESQVGQLEKLVTDLLDTSKIQADKLILEAKKFNLDELIENTIKDLNPTFTDGHKIIFKNKIQVEVKGDKDRINQVLTNLINNAVKYSPEKSEIIINMIHRRRNVIVSVKDSGVGIDSSLLKSIFDRFYQAGNKLKTQPNMPSLGLGLYIASKIINKHRGKIWATSQKGKGSTFYFSLPTVKN